MSNVQNQSGSSSIHEKVYEKQQNLVLFEMSDMHSGVTGSNSNLRVTSFFFWHENP
jgi:hypothetical protein